MANNEENVLLVLTGFTASGKSTLKGELEQKCFFPIVSRTSRPRGPLEIDGRDYFFVSREALLVMNERKELTAFNNYGGDIIYGTRRNDIVMASQTNVVWSLDIGAAAKVREIIKRDLPDYAEFLISRLLVVQVGPIDKEILKKRYVERRRDGKKARKQLELDFTKRFNNDQEAYPLFRLRMEEEPRVFRRLPQGTKEQEFKDLWSFIEEKQVEIRRQNLQDFLAI